MCASVVFFTSVGTSTWGGRAVTSRRAGEMLKTPRLTAAEAPSATASVASSTRPTTTARIRRVVMRERKVKGPDKANGPAQAPGRHPSEETYGLLQGVGQG